MRWALNAKSLVTLALADIKKPMSAPPRESDQRRPRMSLLLGGSVTAAHLCHGKFEHGAIDGLSCSSSAQRLRPFFGAPFTGRLRAPLQRAPRVQQEFIRPSAQPDCP